ncbi:MAG: hypothetical protein V2I67_10300 [Thermoanaerobaculales bacterium]|jgi:hypothetical protein|nr:hypothetical protein [Thermoanaerobaculales bacterium]
MRVLVATDDLVGPSMAGSALRAWELANTLTDAGHEVRLTAARGSTPPHHSAVTLTTSAGRSWAEAVIAPPWSLHVPVFTGSHTLVVDGVTPLLAELEAMPPTAAVRRRRRTAAARLPLVAARAHAILAAGEAQGRWWRQLLRERPETPVVDLPFGIPAADPPAESMEIDGVPPDWTVALWWGGVWPWLDLETLLSARAKLGDVPLSIVVPTAARPGGAAVDFTADDLRRMASEIGLTDPAVVALESWLPYDRRHLLLNRASVMAVLHHPGRESELAFRTRAMDAVWSATPLLVSNGGEVSRLVQAEDWGEVVAPGDAAAAAAALRRLVHPDAQARHRSALQSQRMQWRWTRLSRALVEALPSIGQTPRGALAPALLRTAAALLGRTSELVR